MLAMNLTDPLDLGLPAWTLPAILAAFLLAAALVFYVGGPVFDAIRHFFGHFIPHSWKNRPKAAGEFDLGMSMSRRNSVRRRGNEVVVVVRKTGGAESWQGTIVDRSRTGLCVRLANEFPKGARLEVRADDAAPWVEVEVRRAINKNGEWETGCQFPSQPADEVIAQFG